MKLIANAICPLFSSVNPTYESNKVWQWHHNDVIISSDFWNIYMKILFLIGMVIGLLYGERERKALFPYSEWYCKITTTVNIWSAKSVINRGWFDHFSKTILDLLMTTPKQTLSQGPLSTRKMKEETKEKLIFYFFFLQ